MRVLTPGTHAWPDVIVPVLVALALLVVPGAVTLRLLGARALLSLAAAPAVSTMIIVGGGSVTAALGRPSSIVAVVCATLTTWLVAAICSTLITRLRRRHLDSAREDSASAAGAASRGDAPKAPAWADAAWLLVGTAVAALIIGWVLIHSADSPEQFPQHPDTIFHLGTTQWMAQNLDVSFQHGLRFTGTLTNTSYPVGFHSMAATVSLITGVPAVVSTSALVLATAAVIWPFGMGLLSRTVFGGAVAAGLGALSSALFIAFPFMLIGFGPVWPNLYGQAMVPAVLSAALGVIGILARNGQSPGAPATCTVVILAALPGLAVAHPQAVLTAAVLAAVATWTAAARRFCGGPGTPHRRLPFLVVNAVLAAAALASVALAPASMRDTGEPGPEMTSADALSDIAGLAPRDAGAEPAMGVVVLLGIAIVIILLRTALWIVPALALFTVAYFLNTAVDDTVARMVTWPWFNNAIRLAGVAVLPAALAATAALLAPARLIALRLTGGGSRAWMVESACASGLAALLAIPTGAGIQRDIEWLWPYYHPGTARSWVSPEELRDLRELAGSLPEGAVVAASPWNGGSYMYIVAGTRMFWPTEKTNTTTERRLLALLLNDIDTNPVICRFAKEAGITHALTGGVPFLWGEEEARMEFGGVDRIHESPAWREVARSGDYRLFEFTQCTP